MNGIHFRAPWGTLLKVSSALVTLLLLFVSPVVAAALPGNAPAILGWLIILTGPVTLACLVPFVVRGYTVTPGLLSIQRSFWTTRIPLVGLKGVVARPGVMKGSIRLLGNGGGFVMAGLFRNRELGLYRSFVNDLNRTVVLTFPGRTVVVSPDNPAAFVEAVQQNAVASPAE